MDGAGMELEEDQRTALRTGSKQVRRAAALLRSVNPESFKVAETARRICDQAWGKRASEPTIEEVAQGFADILRYCPTLGPATQEAIQSNLERLIDRMGLTREVNWALVIPGSSDNGRGR